HERTKFTVEEKRRGGANSSELNVATCEKKARRGSRKNVQRARLREKGHEEVTQEGSTCPLARKKPRGGHAGRFNVPSSEKKATRRSRRNVQRAGLREKIHKEVTQERSRCTIGRKKQRGGNSGTDRVTDSERNATRTSC